MRLSRRSVLTGLPGLACLGAPRAHAGPLLPRGPGPATARAGGAPGSRTKILEVYGFGGVFRWNTLRPASLPFVPGEAPFDLPLGTADWAAIAGNDAWAPLTEEPVVVGDLAFGPAASPLLGDLGERTRLVAMGHDLNAHEVAEPLVLTGQRPGRASAMGLGAMVNVLRNDGRNHAVVLDCANAVIPRRAATSTGLWGLDYRPVTFPVPMAEMIALLQRPGLTSLDELRNAMVASYADRLRFQGTPLRAQGFDAYRGAWADLYDHEALAALLTEEQVARASSSTGTYADGAPAQAVRLALELLRGDGDIDCVTVLEGSSTQSYDTHQNTGSIQDGGAWSILRALAECHAETPLDDVIVYLHADFGRLDLDGDHTGSEHWCYGYHNVLLGALPSPGLVGELGESTGGLPLGGDRAFSPTDVYAALLWAAQPEGSRRDPYTELAGDPDGQLPLLDPTLRGASAASTDFADTAEEMFG